MFSFSFFGSATLLAVLVLSFIHLMAASSVFFYPAKPIAKNRLISYLSFAVYSQLALLFMAFALLMLAFLYNDFAVAYVAMNSNSQLPLLFKIGAVWGGHEGSMLLWLLIFTTWISAAVFFLNRQNRETIGTSAFIRFFFWIGLIQSCFVCFLLFLSNPFTLLVPAASEGIDLNPLLQDILLIIHPPILYAGYVGSGIIFAFAMVALSGQSTETGYTWLRLVKPWINWIWAFLTLGIILGSYWAYYELGWGGWWFWDPVENISLIPWLLLAALVHVLHITIRTGTMRLWTIILAFFTFITAFFGTFLVRSGLLTSVHSFASDPERGLFLLGIMAIFVVLFIYALIRYQPVNTQPAFSLLSRPLFMLLGNLVLFLAAFVLILGVLYPVFIPDVAVGAPYYYLVFVPLMLLLTILIALGINLGWQVSPVKNFLLKNIWFLLSSAFTAAGALYYSFPFWNWLVYGTALLMFWLLISHLAVLYRSISTQSEVTKHLIILIAHSGFALLIFSAIVNTVYQKELNQPVRLQESISMENYLFHFNNITYGKEHNYVLVKAEFAVYEQQKPITYLYPEKRLYLVRQNILSETAIWPGLFADWLITLGEQIKDESGSAEERWMVRIQYQPFVRLIWLSMFCIGLAAILAILRTWFLKKIIRRDLSITL